MDNSTAERFTVANSTSQVAVSTSAQLLATSPSNAGPAMSSYTFQNAGASDCYLGATNAVSATTGFLLKAGAGFSADLAPGDKMYARCDPSGSTTVHVYAEVPS